MNTLNICNDDAPNTLFSTAINENASGETEASNPKNSVFNITKKFGLRNEFKRALNASITYDAQVGVGMTAALVFVPKLGKQKLAENIAPDVVGELVAMPPDTPPSDLIAQEDGTDALTGLLMPAAAPAMRYQLLTDGDLCKLPPIQWRIKYVLPSHGTAVVFGPSGSGKSFLVLDMLQCLASGREWFGQKVKQCPVTYVALEGEAGLAGLFMRAVA